MQRCSKPIEIEYSTNFGREPHGILFPQIFLHAASMSSPWMWLSISTSRKHRRHTCIGSDVLGGSAILALRWISLHWMINITFTALSKNWPQKYAQFLQPSTATYIVSKAELGDGKRFDGRFEKNDQIKHWHAHVDSESFKNKTKEQAAQGKTNERKGYVLTACHGVALIWNELVFDFQITQCRWRRKWERKKKKLKSALEI